MTAKAQTASPESSQVLMNADDLTFDENSGIVTARGSVELSQGERILVADLISYDQNTDTVTASGNVSLVEPSGEVIFSNYAVLENELKTGFIENLRVLLSDGSRMAANRAERSAGQRKVMEKAVFSPCALCREDPARAPLWQIKAAQVIHHEARQDIEYRDAVLELFGVPVLYTPYLVHPDPTVERRSGLLTPTLGHSDELGFIYGQPFFYAINDASDIEVEPIGYSREGLILRSRYRHAFSNGQLDFKSTTGLLRDRSTVTNDDGVQASADLEGRFSLNDTWRTGFDFEQASKRTYLRRFRLGNEEVLTSRLFLEGFRSRNYASLNAFKFQGLRAGDDRARQPTVLPQAHYSFVGEPDPYGGRFEFDVSALSLTRETGADSRKLSLTGGWSLPYYAPAGDVYKLTASVQSDFYTANNPTGVASGPASGNEEETGRIFPQVGLNWRLPLVKVTENSSQIIEPIINVVAGPNGGNPNEIPNEDSQAFEFDDTNIFELNRFEGTDRVTSGARVDYGLKAALFDTELGSSQVFIGQSYQFWGNSAFDSGSGLDTDLSDYVGRVHLAPAEWLDLLFRFRLDKDSFKPRRSELVLRLLQPSYSVLIDYVLLDEQLSTVNFGNREQLDLNLNLRLNQNWSASTRLVQDFSNGSNRTRIASLGFNYSDECFAIGLEYERRDLRDADIEPEDRVTLRINFKHLGSVESF
ncbi:MAG: LPS assembly protein LptD [Alphaproteobacteria bacterium]|nr:LPS assembly protein LptD [Alphaproteobacteria bacterium]